MSNPYKGEASLGGVRLKLDVNALCVLEERGEDFAAIVVQAQEKSVIALRKLVWLLMLRHQPEATLQDAGDLISEHGPDEVTAALSRLLEAQALTEEERASGNAPAPGKRKPRRKAGATS